MNSRRTLLTLAAAALLLAVAGLSLRNAGTVRHAPESGPTPAPVRAAAASLVPAPRLPVVRAPGASGVTAAWDSAVPQGAAIEWRAADGWLGAEPREELPGLWLGSWQAVLPDGASLHADIYQPDDLPYPIRRVVLLDPYGREQSRSEAVANRVIVRPLPGAQDRVLAAAEALHARAEPLGATGLYRVTFPGLTPDGVERAMAAFADALYAEPDYIAYACATPNDPRFLDGSLWGLHNTGQNEGVAGADIDAPEGWDIRHSADNVVVAVIDSGVRYTHEDIAANMWINPGETGPDVFGIDRSVNGIDDDGNGYIDDVHGINAYLGNGIPMDNNGHGSHCAGTIGAVGDNGKGVVGVAWRVKIMALKFLGSGASGSLSDAILCIDYAIAHGAALSSNSWGTNDFSQSLFDTVARARDAGLLLIAAAGNDRSNTDQFPFYPASFPLENVISVAATNRRDQLASFSNYGPGIVEIGAPGEAILSLYSDSDSAYQLLSGTSMATPHVAGTVALLRAHFPESDAFGIRNRLLRGGRPLDALTGKTNSGRILNVPGALATTTDAPLNDRFADALPILQDPGTMRGTNRHASSEPGEPLHAGHNGGSVWFRHTPKTPGTTVVSTHGSRFDTVLAVYTGDAVDALTLVAANDNDGAYTTSRVTFEAAEDTTYHIVVAGKGSARGYYELHISGPPREDHLRNAYVAESFPFTYANTNTNASREPGEPLHAGQPGGGSLWLRLRLADFGAASQNIVLTTARSAIDTLLAVYTAAVAEPGYADLVPVVANDNAPYGNTQSEVSFFAVADRTYWIAIDGKNNARGNVRLWAHFKVVNDDFADAIALPSEPNVTLEVAAATLIQATREPGEPRHANAGLGNSLWWTWTPPAEGAYVLRTNANTAIGVYTGTAVNALTLVAPDQNPGRSTSYVLLGGARAGTVYRIAFDVRPEGTSLQSISLFIEPHEVVTYDRLAAAAIMEGIPSAATPLVFTGSNRNAGLEPGEPAGDGFMHRTVWIKWTAPVSGQFAAHTHWTAFDSTLAVFSGPAHATAFDQLALIDIDWDDGIFNDAWLRFEAVAGQTYYFQVGGNTVADFGEFRLAVEPFTPPPNDHFANAETLTGFFVQRVVPNFGATREPGEPDHATNDTWHNDTTIFYYTEIPRAYQTLWYKWTPADATQARRTTASTFHSGTYTIVAVYETTAANPTFADLTMVTPGASMMWGSWWPWGEISWNAQLGKTYYIMLGTDLVDNYEELAFTFWQNPNDNFAERQIIPSESTISIYGANYAATRESGEPVLSNPYNHFGGRSQWYEWTAPADGVYSIDTYGSHSKNYFGRSSPAPAREVMQMLLGVYSGDSLDSLRVVTTSGGQSMWDFNARAIFNAVAGTRYKIALDTRVGPGSIINQPRTQWVFRTSTQLNIIRGSLPNDHLADAKPIHGVQHSEFIDISFATRQPGEPSHGGRALKSAWWKWTAPESGTFWVATASDIFADNHNRKPGIAVYEGPAHNPGFSQLVKLAEHGGGPDRHNPARTSFWADVGRTYYIAVDTGGPDADFYGYGTGLFLGRRPSNDDFENATVVTGSRRVVTGHNIGATEQPGEPYIDPSWRDPGTKSCSVWWRWTAPASGRTTIANKPGSFIYTELGVYTGESVTALTEVAKQTRGIHFDNGKTYEERVNLGCRSVTFNAVAGTTYHIQINGSGYWKTSQGLITLTIEGQPGVPFPPENLVARRVNAARVDLAWTPAAVDAASYAVERAPRRSGPWQRVFDSGHPDTAAWSDLDAGENAFYRVRAEGPGGVSDWVTSFALGGTGDADGDGVPDLLENALGSDPLDADDRALPRVGLTRDAGQPRLSLAFTPAVVDGLRYYIETSNDFATWTPAADLTALLQPGQPFLHVDPADLAAGPRRFLRLIVTPSVE